MKDYIKPTLRELDAEYVIWHAGMNNLKPSLSPKEIAQMVYN